MKSRGTMRAALAGIILAAGMAATATPASAQLIEASDGIHAGELAIPVNKSQVLRTDRPFARARRQQ